MMSKPLSMSLQPCSGWPKDGGIVIMASCQIEIAVDQRKRDSSAWRFLKVSDHRPDVFAHPCSTPWATSYRKRPHSSAHWNARVRIVMRHPAPSYDNILRSVFAIRLF